jgi:hypothetical protein
VRFLWSSRRVPWGRVGRSRAQSFKIVSSRPGPIPTDCPGVRAGLPQHASRRQAQFFDQAVEPWQIAGPCEWTSPQQKAPTIALVRFLSGIRHLWVAENPSDQNCLAVRREGWIPHVGGLTLAARAHARSLPPLGRGMFVAVVLIAWRSRRSLRDVVIEYPVPVTVASAVVVVLLYERLRRGPGAHHSTTAVAATRAHSSPSTPPRRRSR